MVLMEGVCVSRKWTCQFEDALGSHPGMFC